MKKGFLKLIGGNLLVLFILLIVVEIALRVLGIGYGNSPVNPDAMLHHVHPKNYSFTSYSSANEFGGHEVIFDEEGKVVPRHGMNAGQSRNRPVIAFLGDSFVESLQVPWNSSFIGCLQSRIPGIEMQNYGVSSYSPSLHYLLAKNILLKRQPLPAKAVILLYSNDVADDINYLKSGIFEGQELIAVNGGTSSWTVQLLRKSYLVRLLRKVAITLEYAWQHKDDPQNTVKQGEVGGFIEENPDWEGTSSADYLEKTVRLLEASGIKTFVTAVPSKFRYFNDGVEGLEFSEKIEQWAAKRQISFISLTAPFKQWRAQGGGQLFFEKDIHFNTTGHQLAAKVIAPFLINGKW